MHRRDHRVDSELSFSEPVQVWALFPHTIFAVVYRFDCRAKRGIDFIDPHVARG
jgi:hypothetical protein